MSSALGTGTTNADGPADDAVERTSAATVWRITDEASDRSSVPDTNSITAANGVTARIERSDDNSSRLAAVDRLVIIDAQGNVAWTVAAGGVAAPDLGLVDFDGRYVLLVRQSRITGDGPERSDDTPGDAQHIVYDLDCRTVNAEDCVDDFWAQPGSAELTATERTPANNDLNIQLLALCPTAGQRFSQPSELSAPQAQAFEQVAAVLSTCDGAGVDEDPSMLRFNPSAGESGWRWSEYAEALEGPYSVSGDRVTWGPTSAGSTVQVTINDDAGSVSTTFTAAGSEPWGQLSIMRGQNHLLLTGVADEESANQLANAAFQLAQAEGLELIDRIEFAGPGAPPSAIESLLTTVTGELADANAGHIHLNSNGRVSQWTTTNTRPTSEELDAVTALGDFAVGDTTAFNDIPLAPEVYLAAGDRIVAKRSSRDLRDRAGWRMDLASLGDAPGPFNILNQAHGAKDVTVGALAGCDDTAPLPAPGQLASLRRLSLQPDARGLQSCRQWNSVELYLSDVGEIEGVALNLYSR